MAAMRVADLSELPMATGSPEPGAGPCILVVDDDEVVRAQVARRLTVVGMSVVEAGDGATAMELAARHAPALIVLDLCLPDTTGIDVLAALRSASDVPVILLSGLGEESDRVAGLELGADDYVVKPFSSRELLARIRSVLRRSQPALSLDHLELVFGDLRIAPVPRTVHVGPALVELTRLEFDLLLFLARSPRQVFSRAQLLANVWSSDSEWQDESTVTEHVHRLRRRIEACPAAPRHLVTVRGVGYRFEP